MSRLNFHERLCIFQWVEEAGPSASFTWSSAINFSQVYNGRGFFTVLISLVAFPNSSQQTQKLTPKDTAQIMPYLSVIFQRIDLRSYRTSLALPFLLWKKKKETPQLTQKLCGNLLWYSQSLQPSPPSLFPVCLTVQHNYTLLICCWWVPVLHGASRHVVALCLSFIPVM